MPISDLNILPNLYLGLATPDRSPPKTAFPRSFHTQLTPDCQSNATSPLASPYTGPIKSPSRSPYTRSPTVFATADFGPYFGLGLDGLDGLLTGIQTESLSRNRDGVLPVLEHLLSVGGGRTLSLAANQQHIFAGCQDERGGGIVVFSRDDMRKVACLEGHTGSVLVLLLVEEKKWLISGSSDGSVRIWSTESLTLLMTVQPSFNTSGDIYSLAWDDRNGGTLYFGCQNTDIEFINFGTIDATSDDETGSSQSCAGKTFSRSRSQRSDPNRFFDMGRRDSDNGGCRPVKPVGAQDVPSGSKDGRKVVVPAENVVNSAHYGYIYCLLTIDREGERWLVSGSGDSDVKIWECLPGGGIRHIHTFSDLPGAALSLAVRDSLLFAGCQDGQVKVWDLETRSCIRTIMAQDSDILSMSVVGSDLYTASATGQILRFNASFDCTASFEAHHGAVLTILAAKGDNGEYELISGGHDQWMKLWNVSRAYSPDDPDSIEASEVFAHGMDGDVMLYALAKLVAIPTVSDHKHREDCRKGAHLLRKLLTQMGAEATLIPTQEGKNPIVKAHFHAIGQPKKRVLFYGHYDTQPADEDDWTSEPFELAGKNGYLYGRGVSDNKGPIMAVACAAASLRESRKLDIDIVLIIEGEEESGSAGFNETMRKHKDEIGPIDVILLSNSSWIGEEDPCVVFGMRGVIYASLNISSHNSDAHSGVDGGAVSEPMLAMINLLGKLGGDGKLPIPGFYDQVLPMTKEEAAFYQAVSETSEISTDTIVKKWREPTFSVANIVSSGPSNNTIIPRTVTANVSFRLVPNQDVDAIVASISEYCHSTFSSLNSGMSLQVSVTHQARWWLASTDNPFFQALERSVEKVWGKSPLKIREGGSIPTIPFLEELFGAPCVHLPLGQHSSAAHLSNERLRLLNLRNGKKVIEEYFTSVGQL